MDSTKKSQLILIIVNICIFGSITFIGYRIAHGQDYTPITQAPSNALNILHFNDGYDVRKTPRFVTRYLERKDSETLSLFSGDIVGPSLISNYMKGDQFVPFMNLLDVQIAVPGNHEYDFGEEQFESFKNQMKTKWLVANLKSKKNPGKTINELEEFEIKILNGLKIGLFGLVDTFWQDSSKINKEEYLYEPFDIAAKRVSKLLKDQGCHLIFAVSHMANLSDEKVLRDKNDVDIVFGGHDHIYFVRKLNNKILLKSGTDFEYFSQIKAFFTHEEIGKNYCNDSCQEFDYLLDEEKNQNQVFFNFTLPRSPGNFLNVAIEKVRIVQTDVKDATMMKYISSQIDPMIKEYLLPMVKINTKLDTRETIIKNRETAIGNFYADLTKAYFGTEISMINAGIFKSEKLFPQNTFFRKMDLMKVFPYKRDVFVNLEMTGKEILIAIEESLFVYPKLGSKFLSLSGVTYSLNPLEEPGQRVILSSVLINSIAIDLEKNYEVMTVSGLQDQKYGIEIMKTKSTTTPKNEQMLIIELFEKFAKLTEDQSNVNEFEVFKKQYPGYSLDLISDIKIPENGKGVDRLMMKDGQIGSADTLSGLSYKALRRMRMYTLAGKIINIDNRNLFEINPVIDYRMKIIRKVPI